MDFQTALNKMEKGFLVRRPEWFGYLFIDIDSKLKHAGNKNGHDEINWMMDIVRNDWEVCVARKDKENVAKEKETSQIETMLDETSSHIKRLYYLEEMLHSQHQAMKRIVEETTREIEENRKHLEKISKFIPKFSESLSLIKEYKDTTDKKFSEIKKFMDSFIESKLKSRINTAPATVVVEPSKILKSEKDEKVEYVMSNEEKQEMAALKKKMDAKKRKKVD